MCYMSQLAFTYSKSTMKILEKGVEIYSKLTIIDC